MARTKVGITLTEDTLKRLDEIAEQMGLTKSQAISMLVNKEYLNKYQDEDKVLRHKKATIWQMVAKISKQIDIVYGGNYIMGNKDSQAKARTRNWTFVVYPESVSSNWRDVLDEEHIQWVESPLHDKDTNADGEIKKAHIHVLVMYDGVKSYNQILEITNKINASVPQKCGSAKGLVRYMVHMDNPEKYQYSKQIL